MPTLAPPSARTSSAALGDVLGGLLLDGLLGSMVRLGVAAAELSCREGDSGPAVEPSPLFVPAAEMRRSIAAICRPVLAFLRA